MDASRSWGLNRAIFYAAAKRGFRAFGKGVTPRRAPRGRVVGKSLLKEKKGEEIFHLGDEIAYQAKVGKGDYFTIGGEVRTEEDYDRQVVSRFAGHYRDAWGEALKIVKGYPRPTLLSQIEFFQQVYKPVRDELSRKWTESAASSSWIAKISPWSQLPLTRVTLSESTLPIEKTGATLT